MLIQDRKDPAILLEYPHTLEFYHAAWNRIGVGVYLRHRVVMSNLLAASLWPLKQLLDPC